MGSKGSFNFAFLHGLEAVNDITFLHLQNQFVLNKCDQAIIQLLRFGEGNSSSAAGRRGRALPKRERSWRAAGQLWLGWATFNTRKEEIDPTIYVYVYKFEVYFIFF